MKKIYCELHLFDLNQKVYIVDPETGNKEPVAITTMEGLPEVISAISDNRGVNKVILTGNSVFGEAIAQDIIEYSKRNYSWNDIKVEVLK